jgi:hypothetical protein
MYVKGCYSGVMENGDVTMYLLLRPEQAYDSQCLEVLAVLCTVYCVENRTTRSFRRVTM